MVTPDLRKLAAPMVAQAVSFVAVLVIGVFVATSKPGVHVPPPRVRVSASTIHPSVSPAAAVSTFVLTVQATAKKVPLAGRQVSVLRAATLTSAASGPLNPEDLFTARVPAGSYQVCLSLPTGLEVAGGTESGWPGWACTAVLVQADTGTSPVTFSLVPKPPRKARL